MLNDKVKFYIDKSVLCWLATVNADGEPNVSPKEIFTIYDDKTLIIAMIASPQTLDNIKHSSKVCLSFIDVFIQKGFQIKGNAHAIHITQPLFNTYLKTLQHQFGQNIKTNFPFDNIIEINVESVKKIVAPSYMLHPNTTTQDNQIKSALKNYISKIN